MIQVRWLGVLAVVVLLTSCGRLFPLGEIGQGSMNQLDPMEGAPAISLLPLSAPIDLKEIPYGEAAPRWQQQVDGIRHLALSPSGDLIAVWSTDDRGPILQVLDIDGRALWSVAGSFDPSSPVNGSLSDIGLCAQWMQLTDGTGEVLLYREGFRVMQEPFEGEVRVMISPSGKYWALEDDRVLRVFSLDSGLNTLELPQEGGVATSFVPSEDVLVVDAVDELRLLGPTGIEWGRFPWPSSLRSDVTMGHRGEFIALSTAPPDGALYVSFLAEEHRWTRLLPADRSFQLVTGIDSGHILVYPVEHGGPLFWVRSRSGELSHQWDLPSDVAETVTDIRLRPNLDLMIRMHSPEGDAWVHFSPTNPERSRKWSETFPGEMVMAEDGQAFLRWNPGEDLIQYYRTFDMMELPD